jgi:rfaE bifunctional protein nucleotidyltransferase chain/domain
MKKLNISVIQLHIEKDFEKNLKKIKEFLKKAKGKLVLFPELALTGYKKNYEVEKIEKGLKEILQVCKIEKKSVLIGAPLKKNELWFNAVFLLKEDVIKPVAEKSLLFPDVDEGFSTGERREILNIEDVRTGLVICFELRSPEIFRLQLKKGVDVFLVFAQWPLSRKEHWEVLLRARAIENKCWVIGINACGDSFEPLAGSSQIINPWGKITGLGYEEGILESFIEDVEVFYPLKTPFLEKNKLFKLEELKEIVERRRKKGQKMVFTNGCFDIIHAGHVSYLESARKLGDFLIVGLNSDASIKKIKGEKRPINPEEQRIKVLSSLECVDYIVLFEEETPEKLIHYLKPDVLVKGEDWEEDKIIGAKFVKSYGGEVKRIKFKYKTSTSKIIEKILKIYQDD